MIFTLGLSAYEPRGIINFEKYEGKDMLIAYREGTASCYTVIRLKTNEKYYIKSACFGIDKFNSTYTVHGDTVVFNGANEKNNSYKFIFGVINRELSGRDGRGVFILFKANDTKPYPMDISVSSESP